MGIGAILGGLPTILRRVYGTAAAGRRGRARRARHHRQPRVHAPDRAARAQPPPRSRSSTTCRPSVWAWRPGRAAQDARRTSITCWRCCRSSPMRTRAAWAAPCTYVGHPLIERLRVDLGARHRGLWPTPGAAGRRAAAAGAAGQPHLRGQAPDAAVRGARGAADGARAQVQGGDARGRVGARADRAAASLADAPARCWTARRTSSAPSSWRAPRSRPPAP